MRNQNLRRQQFCVLGGRFRELADDRARGGLETDLERKLQGKLELARVEHSSRLPESSIRRIRN